ncbi:DUF2969 family protein [Weissella sagaensis]|jgi:U3 small nucleolar ribonucleoprotein component|uniref:DUF2969 family protein n=1 Tax=Weissella sagaensis TaxID=2559928 RepID=A0ABW1RSL3_9LACO|nr:DUF2969 family protein [Weissella sagaensis]KAA8434058.1 DUF2969 family protein [Weissella paramesenteroides]MBU7568027.1 DUF2969 family protein [Weissella hellenica]KAA8438172.1 DUF2969 family protein [Weissella paramesenteroides]QDJ58302.1 DUF2969 family protein [Weissella hellenica]QEA57294.1 DUF2969 family protein [Weissella hellenica]
MARKNKPVAVEINELDDSVSQIIINKVILGTVDEKDSPLVVTFADGHTQTADNFDNAVASLLAEYNLHH